MKKLKFAAFMMGAIFMSAGFTACSSDDDDVINILVEGSTPSEVTVGELITFEYNVVSDNKIDEIRYLLDNVEFDKESKVKEATFKGVFSYTPETVGELNFGIEVKDSKGKIETRAFKVNVKAAAGEIETYEAVLLGGYDTSLPSFYSISEQTAYLMKDAKTNQAKVDFLYYYIASKGATIAAPNDETAATIFTNAANGLATWTTKNETKFKAIEMTATEFDNLENDAQITIEENIIESFASMLTKDHVILFETVTGKKGVFKVLEVEEGAKSQIKIQVKVQK